MSEKKRIIGMSQADKERLLKSMLQRGNTDPMPSRGLTRVIDPGLLRFDTLPSYTQIAVQKAVGDKLGIVQPYYICHDSLSQATAKIGGKSYLNFSCYDYLGLNGDERILARVSEAARKYGFSASASRLTAGERPPHRALEERIAALYGTEDSLVFVSGHATNMSTIPTLFGPQDVIFHDKASHNSLIMGAKLSGAARFAFPNNSIDSLRSLLAEHRSSFQRALIVTEGLFGMDGVICHLPELVALKKEFGCFLMVDEAHSMGNLGAHGHGVREHFGLNPEDVDIWMGTLSKTFCGCGGYIAGSRILTELLRYEAPGFVYSVGMPPMLAEGSLAAIEYMDEEVWRVEKLHTNSRTMLTLAREAGLDTGLADGYAVIPVMIGDSVTAVLTSHMLREEGILVLPIIYPGVEEGRARLRFFVSASHEKAQLEEAVSKTAQLLPRARARAQGFVE